MVVIIVIIAGIDSSDKSVVVLSALVLESDEVGIFTANAGRKDISTPPSVGRRAATAALHSSCIISMAMTVMPMIQLYDITKVLVQFIIGANT